jgi:hypothetical protein
VMHSLRACVRACCVWDGVLYVWCTALQRAVGGWGLQNPPEPPSPGFVCGRACLCAGCKRFVYVAKVRPPSGGPLLGGTVATRRPPAHTSPMSQRTLSGLCDTTLRRALRVCTARLRLCGLEQHTVDIPVLSRQGAAPHRRRAAVCGVRQGRWRGLRLLLYVPHARGSVRGGCATAATARRAPPPLQTRWACLPESRVCVCANVRAPVDSTVSNQFCNVCSGKPAPAGPGQVRRRRRIVLAPVRVCWGVASQVCRQARPCSLPYTRRGR